MTQTLLIIAGAITIALCIYIQNFLKLNSQQNSKINTLRITQYIPWIIKEIAKADWQIVKIILKDKINIQQQLIKINTKQKNDSTKTILANSITLTPGTITVETLQTKNNKNEFIIHSIYDKHDNPQNNIDELINMETKVSKLEET